MTEFTSSKTDLSPGYRPAKTTEHYALVFVLLLHVCATFIFLPPTEILSRKPLLYIDYPLHTHRIYMYRQALLESGSPWGYDPAVSAGMVTTPLQDVGAKPIQVLGVLLAFLPPFTVMRLFLFLVVLTSPLWTLLACRRLGIPTGTQVWIMSTIIFPSWLLTPLSKFYYFGLTAFTASSYFAPYVLALFLNFLARPGLKVYLAFLFSASLLFLLHILGPVAIIPPLVLYTVASRSVRWRWRTAAVLTPLGVLVLNAFWILPLLLALEIPRPPFPHMPTLVGPSHLTFGSWSQILDRLSLFRFSVILCGLGLSIIGTISLKKMSSYREATSFALAAAFCLFLVFLGSFMSIFTRMQPTRFLLPAFVLMAMPVGVALSDLTKKLSLQAGASAATLALAISALACLLGKPVPLPHPPSPDPLADFVAERTGTADRLLVQSTNYWRRGGYEARILPLAFGREVLGCTFPAFDNSAQFFDHTLFGRNLSDWLPDDLRPALERWGVSWVFTKTEEARLLFAETLDNQGETVGQYRAFQILGNSSKFLLGKGVVMAKVNRLELTELTPEDDLIVIRYRYHPAWEANMHIPVYQYPVPEDTAGFIALKAPPDKVVLRFKPTKIFHADWPR